MTPAQFQARVKKGTVPPATLLLGPEAYERRRIKNALLATLPADAVSQHDLGELTLAEILDDARALSLFASERHHLGCECRTRSAPWTRRRR